MYVLLLLMYISIIQYTLEHISILYYYYIVVYI
jgi:hypothetical protein